MSDEWFYTIFWSSISLGIFMIKQCVEFSLIVLNTLKEICKIKESKILSFLPMKNNPVTIGLNFLLDSIFATISSSTTNFLLSFINITNCFWITDEYFSIF